MCCEEDNLTCNMVRPYTHTLLQAKQNLTVDTAVVRLSHMQKKKKDSRNQHSVHFVLCHLYTSIILPKA